MKLSKPAADAVKKSKPLQRLLAYVLGVHTQTVVIYAKNNENNGLLTTIKALEAIAAETGMFQNQILIEEKQQVV